MAKKNKRGQTNNEGVEFERDDKITFEGLVDEALPGTLFRVVCDNDHVVIATLAGKLRQNRIRILPGDRVVVEVSPYDVTRGRIAWRS